MSPLVGTILLVVFIALVVLVISRSIRIVPQATAGIVERFGRYHRTLNAGLNMVTPFVDRLRPLIDLREQVVSFPPQPVITRDNLVVSIDTVIYFQVTDARAATYEVANYITAVEQLTVTTLRNVVGGMELEHALTSRDQINSELRKELDEATGKWGIRVGRVELKAIEPPGSIQDSMEKQMRADRDKRAAILSAEGSKQSAILTAEGERQAAVLKARGESEAVVLRAEADAKAQAARARGQAEAISTVFKAIHDGNPDQRLLAYQYMQMLPQIAQGDANKVWIVPSEIGKALEGLGGFFSGATAARADGPSSPPAPAAPAASGAGPQLDAPVGRHASLEGWLAGSGRPVHDGAIADHEGGSVPGAGDAGGAPLHHDPALVEGSSEMRASV
jgi:regulator of protease activity HflC (stomatin/prohibitin superfamily)